MKLQHDQFMADLKAQADQRAREGRAAREASRERRDEPKSILKKPGSRKGPKKKVGFNPDEDRVFLYSKQDPPELSEQDRELREAQSASRNRMKRAEDEQKEREAKQHALREIARIGCSSEDYRGFLDFARNVVFDRKRGTKRDFDYRSDTYIPKGVHAVPNDVEAIRRMIQTSKGIFKRKNAAAKKKYQKGAARFQGIAAKERTRYNPIDPKNGVYVPAILYSAYIKALKVLEEYGKKLSPGFTVTGASGPKSTSTSGGNPQTRTSTTNSGGNAA